jgi:hypothetical protein
MSVSERSAQQANVCVWCTRSITSTYSRRRWGVLYRRRAIVSRCGIARAGGYVGLGRVRARRSIVNTNRRRRRRVLWWERTQTSVSESRSEGARIANAFVCTGSRANTYSRRRRGVLCWRRAIVSRCRVEREIARIWSSRVSA